MISELVSKYEKGKSKKIKLIALCIKAVTGVLGGSMILSNQHPYLSIAILAIGAAANEITNFFSTEEQERAPGSQP